MHYNIEAAEFEIKRLQGCCEGYRARIKELESQAGLYPGQNNFRFHVVSDDAFDATPAAHEWLNRQREEAKRDERERIIALLESGWGTDGAKTRADLEPK